MPLPTAISEQGRLLSVNIHQEPAIDLGHLIPGMKLWPLFLDPENGTWVMYAVYAPGTRLPKHFHTGAVHFFTTKGTGKGTGLGLSQVYGFANQSGGELVIDSAPGKGSTVSIVLPYSAAPLPQAESTAAEARTGRTGSVLLVEDNEEVGEFAETLLHELGHQVTRVISASEALEAIATRSFDVVFTDVVMPVMSGLELADALAKIRPGLPVVLTTGFSDELTRSGAGGRPVVLKPYRIESLATVLEEALEKTPA